MSARRRDPLRWGPGVRARAFTVSGGGRAVTRRLADQVVVITGAGRGLGREYARYFGAQGARVVVSDLGCAVDGRSTDDSVARSVASEIEREGGRATAVTGDIATMEGAVALLDGALAAFGRVDALVANAGILRDRMFVNTSIEDWHACLRGHLDTMFAPCQTFASHWRNQVKAGNDVRASIVTTTSTSGLFGQVGQVGYGAAKAGIAAATTIMAEELARYGVRVNAVAPGARTRMTEDLPGGVGDALAPPEDSGAFDEWHPRNVAPLVAWLSAPTCTVTGQVFLAKGGEVCRLHGWTRGESILKDHRFALEDLDAAMGRLVDDRRVEDAGASR
jgi:NAD(P)-dependent dehydrogenase (short-subunit alcohol dehydrogenase family)